jgi:exopolyphosphatase/guanosine-5'-triphosphate,3'-diphosphate pyrophosphatase
MSSERDPTYGENPVFASIDLGSNSFHMIVARIDHGSLQVIDRIKEMVRLAEGVDEQGNLDPKVEQRALDCLSRFGQRIEQISQIRTAAVGTNALRRLKRDWQFLSEAESRLGVPIEVISGQEEARLIYRGVAEAITPQGRQRLVIDIGGGSTEFIIGRDADAKLLESLYFGCVSVTNHFFSDGKITARRWQQAKTAVALELQRIAKDYRKSGWQEVLGSSGTMKAVRNVVVSEGWSERGITPQSLLKLSQHLVNIGDTDQLKLAGLSDRRRPVFAGGAAVVAACLEVLEIDQIIVTDHALREGLLHELQGRNQENDPRAAAVAGLAERYRIDQQQAERVERTALKLFDQVAKQWKLGNSERNWLCWAARLHETGLSVSHHGYQRHGAYLIENSDLPGFSRLEQMILATLVLNHRRRPILASFETLINRTRESVKHLAVLLRVAVLLNRSRSTRDPASVTAGASKGQLLLDFEAGSLAQTPLTLADLHAEKSQLEQLEFRFSGSWYEQSS